MLAWNEWECPNCRRIGSVDAYREWKPGDVCEIDCPVCGEPLAVEACESLEFVAHKVEFAPESRNCEFCDGFSNPQVRGNPASQRLLACIRGHTMVLRALDIEGIPQWLVDVDYCPKCGRKL